MDTPINEERRMARMVESGSTIEAVGGVAAVILAVVGLANIESSLMAAITAIVLGGALLLQGGLVAAEYTEILSRFEGGTYAEFGGGLGAETLAGVAAMVLGVLALFGLNAQNLVSVAAIVLGSGLVLSTGVVMRLNSVKIDIAEGSGAAKAAANDAISAAGFTQVFVGLVAVVLGVLALIGLNPLILSLVAMLVVGASTMLSGGAMFGTMMSFFNR